MKFKLLFKTMTYGMIHLGVAIAVAYAITGDLKMSLGIGIIEPIIQTAVFSIHDYLWERKKSV